VLVAQVNFIFLRAIVTFAGVEDWRQQRFIDVGCGSGLFSLAAYKLGAKEVVSIDIDAASTACARYLHQLEGKPDNWQVFEGSVLDRTFVSMMRPGTFVYSWGVLHHTGSMWQAIRNVEELVAPQGILWVALYNQYRYSPAWLAIKQLYNRVPGPLQLSMRMTYACFSILMLIRRGRNPIRAIRDYPHASRGMSWWRDIEDWLGGLPYEYSRPDQVIDFVKKLGLTCVKMGMQ